MDSSMTFNRFLLTAAFMAGVVFPFSLEAAPVEKHMDGDPSAKVHVVILGKDSGLDDFPTEAIYEEGDLVNGVRNGLWQRYFPTGAIRSEIHFAGGDAFGDYRLYNQSGELYEEGRWEHGMNVGKLRRFWPDGTIQQLLTFDSQGVGQGEQRHYHNNGQLEMVVQLLDGEEAGDLIRLDREGRVMSRTTFEDGRAIQRGH
jgi:antitoxin component YwqK of YwqJK toxin-antitoxin module